MVPTPMVLVQSLWSVGGPVVVQCHMIHVINKTAGPQAEICQGGFFSLIQVGIYTKLFQTESISFGLFIIVF